jgi:hypothetical protein
MHSSIAFSILLFPVNSEAIAVEFHLTSRLTRACDRHTARLAGSARGGTARLPGGVGAVCTRSGGWMRALAHWGPAGLSATLRRARRLTRRFAGRAAGMTQAEPRRTHTTQRGRPIICTTGVVRLSFPVPPLVRRVVSELCPSDSPR